MRREVKPLKISKRTMRLYHNRICPELPPKLPSWLFLPTDDYDHELQASKDWWEIHGDGFKW